MQADDIIDAVSRASLWRSNPDGWTAADPDLSRASATGFEYAPPVLEQVPAVGVHLLTGPRRAGKTVATLQRVADVLTGGTLAPAQVVRASLDRFGSDDLWALLTSPRIADTLGLPREEPRLWILDEITSVPGWVGAIKEAVESDGPLARDAVVVTGSCAPEIAPNTLTVNGARTWQRLLPMSFRETCSVAKIDLPDLVAAPDLMASAELFAEIHATIGKRLQTAFDEYLCHGGYPLAVGAHFETISDSRVASQADGLVDSVLLGAASDTDLDPEEVRVALMAILNGTCSPTSVASFGQVVGGSRDNAERILGQLERAHVAWRIYRAKDSQREAYTDAAHPKLYLTDPLLARAAGADPAAHRGALFETIVGVHLARAACPQGMPFWQGLRFDLLAEGTEIDFLPVPAKVPAVEAKSGGPGDGPAQLLSLQGGGIVATSSELDLRDRVWCVPAAYVAAVLELRS